MKKVLNTLPIALLLAVASFDLIQIIAYVFYPQSEIAQSITTFIQSI